MASPPEPLELPGPNGSAIPTNFRSQRTTLQLPDATVDRVTAVAKEYGATPYMVLLAAFGVLIHRYTHSDDFLVAAPVLNRTADLTMSSAITATRSRFACVHSAVRHSGRRLPRPATPRSAPSPTSG